MILLLAPASAIRLPVVRRRDAVALGAAAGLHSQRAASAAESGSPAARLEELKTLGARAEQSQAKQTPAFWPGRLEGQPPPTPRVVLKDAPPAASIEAVRAAIGGEPRGWRDAHRER